MNIRITSPFLVSCLATVVVFAFVAGAQGQQSTRNVEQVYQFDERGDAQISWTFELDASHWAQWKSVYGDHPDLLLRLVKHQLAAAVIDDYNLEKDDMHRRAVSKFKARSLAHYRSGGRFEIDIPKNLKLVTGSGTEWIFTGSVPETGGGIINLTYRAKLPAKAHDARMTNGNDTNRLQYDVDVSPSRPKTLLWLGILFLLGGLVAGAMSLRTAPGASRPGWPGSTSPPPLPS